MNVTLTPTEVAEAAHEGALRRIRAIFRGRQFPGGWDDKRVRDKWGSDVESAAAEKAFAKGLGLYWAGSPDPDYQGDVCGWHVRSTDREAGCLIVYLQDPDDARFALVVGEIPSFRIAGWCYGREAKLAEFESGSRLRRPGFMVPQGRLRTFDASSEVAA